MNGERGSTREPEDERSCTSAEGTRVREASPRRDGPVFPPVLDEPSGG